MASGAFGIWAGSITLQPREQLKSQINLVIGANIDPWIITVIIFREYERLIALTLTYDNLYSEEVIKFFLQIWFILLPLTYLINSYCNDYDH